MLSGADLDRLESVIGLRLLACGYQPSNLPLPAPSPADRIRLAAYRAAFGLRLALKTRTPLAQLLAKGELLDAPPAENDADPTLRPGAYPEPVRRVVSGGGPPFREPDPRLEAPGPKGLEKTLL